MRLNSDQDIVIIDVLVEIANAIYGAIAETCYSRKFVKYA